ncbi:ParB/RepB/Spo0J family partition protein [Anaerotruncus rubiinfantis]|uniref:ParB/RepB/Spo0J family partition protein n=1 Tax=Anaerotruncus rubiinfantis TaxID=1720200 RepID=UPI000832D006|nr:ParB N-terminal domain-containing protein [Anaerotruncus rubiinfantis]
MQIRISPNEVKVKSGRRSLNEEKVKSLAQSIEEIGLLNPITIDLEYNLIAGAHRLEAVKRLERDTIECNQVDLKGLQAELAEIDENLVRHNLNHIDEADQLLRRKEIYEELHPDTKAGIAGAKATNEKRWGIATENSSAAIEKSFAADTAAKIGMTERAVRGKIQVAKNLSPEVKAVVKESGISRENALKLARIKDEDKQKEAAEMLAAKKIRTVDEYHAQTEPFVPVVIPGRRFKDMNESIRDLKNVDKECVTTPEMAFMEFAAFAESFIGEAEAYADERHMTAFENMDKEQAQALYDTCDRMAAAILPFYDMAERKMKHGKKESKMAK